MSGEVLDYETGSESFTDSSSLRRWGLLIGGSVLAVYGLKRRSVFGMALAAIGGGMVCRELITLDSRRSEAKLRKGIKIVKAVTVNRSPEELYRYWRNLENLPRFMAHLKSVEVLDRTRSHWVARGPVGTEVEWDAEIINDRENEMIAWRSVEPSDVGHAGSVHFEPAPGDRGTRVKVIMDYHPPLGKISAQIARLLGEEPEQQVREDLRRLKQLFETGIVATAEGQPSGRSEDYEVEKRRGALAGGGRE